MAPDKLITYFWTSYSTVIFPSMLIHSKGKVKNVIQLPSACSIQEDQQNPPGRFKVSRRLFYSSKCKTIRPGSVKGSKTGPERDQKANNKNWENIHFAILQNLQLIIIYLYFSVIIFIIFLNLSSFCVVFFVFIVRFHCLTGFLCPPFHISF